MGVRSSRKNVFASASAVVQTGTRTIGDTAMRNHILACTAALFFFGAAAAEAQIQNYVIQGDAAKKILQKNEISLDTAKRLAAGCEAFAKAHNSSAAIAVLDMFGQEVFFERLDGAFGLTQLVAARRKA